MEAPKGKRIVFPRKDPPPERSPSIQRKIEDRLLVVIRESELDSGAVPIGVDDDGRDAFALRGTGALKVRRHG